MSIIDTSRDWPPEVLHELLVLARRNVFDWTEVASALRSSSFCSTQTHTKWYADINSDTCREWFSLVQERLAAVPQTSSVERTEEDEAIAAAFVSSMQEVDTNLDEEAMKHMTAQQLIDYTTAHAKRLEERNSKVFDRVLTALNRELDPYFNDGSIEKIDSAKAIAATRMDPTMSAFYAAKQVRIKTEQEIAARQSEAMERENLAAAREALKQRWRLTPEEEEEQAAAQAAAAAFTEEREARLAACALPQWTESIDLALVTGPTVKDVEDADSSQITLSMAPLSLQGILGDDEIDRLLDYLEENVASQAGDKSDGEGGPSELAEVLAMLEMGSLDSDSEDDLFSPLMAESHRLFENYCNAKKSSSSGEDLPDEDEEVVADISEEQDDVEESSEDEEVDDIESVSVDEVTPHVNDCFIEDIPLPITAVKATTLDNQPSSNEDILYPPAPPVAEETIVKAPPVASFSGSLLGAANRTAHRGGRPAGKGLMNSTRISAPVNKANTVDTPNDSEDMNTSLESKDVHTSTITSYVSEEIIAELMAIKESQSSRKDIVESYEDPALDIEASEITEFNKTFDPVSDALHLVDAVELPVPSDLPYTVALDGARGVDICFPWTSSFSGDDDLHSPVSLVSLLVLNVSQLPPSKDATSDTRTMLAVETMWRNLSTSYTMRGLRRIGQNPVDGSTGKVSFDLIFEAVDGNALAADIVTILRDISVSEFSDISLADYIRAYDFLSNSTEMLQLLYNWSVSLSAPLVMGENEDPAASIASIMGIPATLMFKPHALFPVPISSTVGQFWGPLSAAVQSAEVHGLRLCGARLIYVDRSISSTEWQKCMSYEWSAIEAAAPTNGNSIPLLALAFVGSSATGMMSANVSDALRDVLGAEDPVLALKTDAGSSLRSRFGRCRNDNVAFTPPFSAARTIHDTSYLFGQRTVSNDKANSGVSIVTLPPVDDYSLVVGIYCNDSSPVALSAAHDFVMRILLPQFSNTAGHIVGIEMFNGNCTSFTACQCTREQWQTADNSTPIQWFAVHLKSAAAPVRIKQAWSEAIASVNSIQHTYVNRLMLLQGSPDSVYSSSMTINSADALNSLSFDSVTNESIVNVLNSSPVSGRSVINTINVPIAATSLDRSSVLGTINTARWQSHADVGLPDVVLVTFTHSPELFYVDVASGVSSILRAWPLSSFPHLLAVRSQSFPSSGPGQNARVQTMCLVRANMYDEISSFASAVKMSLLSYSPNAAAKLARVLTIPQLPSPSKDSNELVSLNNDAESKGIRVSVEGGRKAVDRMLSTFSLPSLCMAPAISAIQDNIPFGTSLLTSPVSPNMSISAALAYRMCQLVVPPAAFNALAAIVLPWSSEPSAGGIPPSVTHMRALSRSVSRLLRNGYNIVAMQSVSNLPVDILKTLWNENREQFPSSNIVPDYCGQLDKSAITILIVEAPSAIVRLRGLIGPSLDEASASVSYPHSLTALLSSLRGPASNNFIPTLLSSFTVSTLSLVLSTVLPAAYQHYNDFVTRQACAGGDVADVTFASSSLPVCDYTEKRILNCAAISTDSSVEEAVRMTIDTSEVAGLIITESLLAEHNLSDILDALSKAGVWICASTTFSVSPAMARELLRAAGASSLTIRCSESALTSGTTIALGLAGPGLALSRLQSLHIAGSTSESLWKLSSGEWGALASSSLRLGKRLFNLLFEESVVPLN